jgi:hypothetical protein
LTLRRSATDALKFCCPQIVREKRVLRHASSEAFRYRLIAKLK